MKDETHDAIEEWELKFSFVESLDRPLVIKRIKKLLAETEDHVLMGVLQYMNAQVRDGIEGDLFLKEMIRYVGHKCMDAAVRAKGDEGV